MDAPLVPNEMSKTSKIALQVVGAVVGLFVVVTLILLILDGVQANKSAMLIVAIGLLLFLITCGLLINYMRQEKFESKVNYIIITQTIGLLVICASLLAYIDQSCPGEADTYILGGASTGISVKSVPMTLTLNGGTPLSLNSPACSAWAFSTKLDKGEKVSITYTQPDNSVCNVGGIPQSISKDYLSMSISCGASVGGRVQGLTGSGLVLQNDYGGQSPDVTTVYAGNSTFIFPTVLPTGSNYRVTVKTPPTPFQNCAVADGEGQITNGNVNSITLTCQ